MGSPPLLLANLDTDSKELRAKVYISLDGNSGSAIKFDVKMEPLKEKNREVGTQNKEEKTVIINAIV